MDCTFKTDEGKFNFRVGAIIRDKNRVLMAKNPSETRDFLYSVGGRVHFGETLEEAVLREVKEETGLEAEIERLFAIHENFFCEHGVPYHEISIFFLIKTSAELKSIKNGTPTDNVKTGEYLEWVDLNDCASKTLYPDFYKTVDFETKKDVLHFITRDM
ncbi:NUDIX domain-containing protein [uncultured Treponema sp.]|uniref:NUDIX hydrolase n=1 Tax=uncultured Treponema sp. TaxID=162155 RepID=UPI0025D4EDBE|nr:NUDIX domain-containing protein [uncultured Treponema sp.]